MDSAKITAVVITQNEEHMIANCLEALKWCDEILVVDSGSTDRTAELVSMQGIRVIPTSSRQTFAELRNLGLKHAKHPWILYIDADERVTPALMHDIRHVVNGPGQFSAYRVGRNNIHYGRWMKSGGWQNDTLVRLFKKDDLKTWEGRVHEHAVIEGEVSDLIEPLIHLTHRNMADGIRKSLQWTDIEAQLLLEAKHPQMTILRLIKATVWEFFNRVIVLKAYKDGMEGLVEAMTQAWNRFLVYERLWELQRIPSLEETYEKYEKDVERLWDNEHA